MLLEDVLHDDEAELSMQDIGPSVEDQTAKPTQRAIHGSVSRKPSLQGKLWSYADLLYC